jgi:hypothetical protein
LYGRTVRALHTKSSGESLTPVLFAVPGAKTGNQEKRMKKLPVVNPPKPEPGKQKPELRKSRPTQFSKS